MCPKVSQVAAPQFGTHHKDTRGQPQGANGPNGVEAIETPGQPPEEVARGVPRKGDQGGGTNRKSRAMPQWIVVQ